PPRSTLHSSPTSLTPPPPTHLSTLSLHDALPISSRRSPRPVTKPSSRAMPRQSPSGCDTGPSARACPGARSCDCRWSTRTNRSRSEEHTSELQSLRHLVCRLLLEKKKKVYGEPNE